jgi:methionine synthase II (cobalamin-independent)
MKRLSLEHVLRQSLFRAESKDSARAPVAERIRIALKYVPAEKLWINPDCGFNPTPRWITLPKLNAMVQGAKIVRRELGQ